MGSALRGQRARTVLPDATIWCASCSKQRHAGGAIVNILSMHAHGGMPSMAVYGSTKAALAAPHAKTSPMRTASSAFAPMRINVGWVDTPAERVMQAATIG